MKRLFLSGCAILVTTSAYAGGIDRSGQDSSILFKDAETYLQLSFGMVNPSVSGVAGVDSGDMAPTYSQTGLGLKHKVSPNIDVAVIYDQPFGANVDYPSGTGYPLAGTNADLSTNAVTVLGRYHLSDRFSVIGGLRQQSVEGDIFINIGGYTLTASDKGGIGYVAGAAYEIPEIALRVAAIYNSGIDHTLTGTEMGGPVAFDIRTPQSVNLTAQSGIAPDTLLMGSVRWVDWDAFDITPPGYAFATGGSLVDYDSDTYSYTLGIGRRFSDAFSGSFTVGYEKSQGTPVSNLGPTDGYLSAQIGGEYKMNDMTVSGGIRYVKIGDATTKPTVSGDFSGNSAVAFGIQVGYRM